MNEKGGWEGMRVGFVLFVALVVLVAGLYLVAFQPALMGDNVRFAVHFSEIGGLITGAPVWIGGVEVGVVDDIIFEEKQKKQVMVVLAVGKKYMKHIRQDSVCRIATKGLLGERIVTITPGSFFSPCIVEAGEIKSEETKDLSETLETVGLGVDRTAAAIVRTLEELEMMLKDIRQQRGILGKLIYSDEFYRDTFKRIDQVVTEVTRSIDDLSGTLRQEVSVFRNDASEAVDSMKAEFATTAEEMRATTKKIHEEVTQAGALFREIREGKGAAGMLIQDASVAAELKEVTSNLNKTLVALASVMEKIDKGKGTAGMLVNDRSAYTSLRDMFEGVNESWLLRNAVVAAETRGRELRLEHGDAADEEAQTQQNAGKTGEGEE